MDADTLKIKRMEQGWTQRDLAKAIGVDPQTISYWECERVKITKPMQMLLERIFKEARSAA